MESLVERLRGRIQYQGPLSFAEFMEESLYGEGGYYRRERLRIGNDGDFVTGSSLSPLFGSVTAEVLRRLDRRLGRPADFLEVGFGEGSHLRAVIEALQEPEARRILAWDRVPRSVPEGVQLLSSLAELEASRIEGLIFSYELFDALPVHRLIWRSGALRELWVDLAPGSEFCWLEGPLSSAALAALVPGSLEEGQIADVSPAWTPLYAELAQWLDRGLLVTCDYGFERDRLFDPRIRRHGTLACYRQQTVHRNPFLAVGEQDLTAHVDFSGLIEAGESGGLTTAAFTRQAAWLAAGGLLEDLAEQPARVRFEAMQLMNLEGMGEEIRVLVQARGVDAFGVLPHLRELENQDLRAWPRPHALPGLRA
jgi:SAM-dependent MidA family methyltransferase